MTTNCTEADPKFSEPVDSRTQGASRNSRKKKKKKEKKIRFETQHRQSYLGIFSIFDFLFTSSIYNFWFTHLRSAPHVYTITKFLRFLNWQFLISLAMVGNSTDIATCAFVAALNIPSRGYKCLGSSLERASPTEDPILDRKNPCTCPKIHWTRGRKWI